MQVFHHLRRSRVRQADGANTPLHRRVCRLIEYQVAYFLPKVRHRLRQLDRATGPFAEPERNSRVHALGISHPYLEPVYPQNLPGVSAQRKHIARHRIEREVLVQATDHRVFGVEHNLIIEHIRNRAAVGQRDEVCATPWPKPPVNRVVMQVCATPSPTAGVAICNHAQCLFKFFFG